MLVGGGAPDGAGGSMSPAFLFWEDISRDWPGWWELGYVESRSSLTSQVMEALVNTTNPCSLEHKPISQCSLAVSGALEQQVFRACVNYTGICWEALRPGVH